VLNVRLEVPKVVAAGFATSQAKEEWEDEPSIL
jgi:hypothetical protein